MLDYVYDENKFVDFKKVEELWSKNTRETVLYLHNPFCIKNNCKYCCHLGYPVTNQKEEVYKFYFDYMPKQLKKYENIINSQNIKLVDFGGGTPNFLHPKLFEKYLKLLPKKIIDLPKVIELHPAYISKGFIDILKKYNFSTLIFCIQTFDKNTLKSQNRMVHNSSNLFSCIRYAKKLGFNVGTDLITYWTKTENDWNILEKDLYLLKWLEPDEITISVLYQNKYYNSDFDGAIVYKRISELTRKIVPDYENPEKTLDNFFNVATTRIYKKDSNIRKDFDIYINSLTCIPWEHEQGYSTIGIGSYKCRTSDVFSVIGPNYTIYEVTDDNFNARYYLAKDYDFWEEAKKEIDKLKEKSNGAEPPTGLNLIFTNIVKNKGEFYKGFVQNGCEIKLAKRQSFLPMSKKELDINHNFFKKLDKSYQLL